MAKIVMTMLSFYFSADSVLTQARCALISLISSVQFSSVQLNPGRLQSVTGSLLRSWTSNFLTEVRRSAPFSRGCHGDSLRIMGYPDKPSSPRGSLSIVLSVLAVHMRTSQRPVGQYVCHWSQSNRAGSLWHVVPRDIGQMYEQPTDHIPHGSHWCHSWVGTVNDSQKVCPSS